MGVSVQGGLCTGGSLYRGVSVLLGSLSRGVSIQGGLCPGGLCLGGGLCPKEEPLSPCEQNNRRKKKNITLRQTLFVGGKIYKISKAAWRMCPVVC